MKTDCDGCSAVSGVQLLEDMERMHLDGPLRSTDQGTDLLVAEPPRHVREDLDLTLRQIDPWRERRDGP